MYVSKQKGVLESGVFFENVCDSSNLQDFFVNTDTLDPAEMVPKVWLRQVRQLHSRMQTAKRRRNKKLPSPPEMLYDSSYDEIMP